MIKKLAVLFLGLFLSVQVWSQDQPLTGEPETERMEEESLNWMVTLSLGYTFVPKGINEGKETKGLYVPSVGLDLWRRIHGRWGAAFVADLELAEYLVDFDREELDREKALLLVLVGTYELLPGWEIMAGGGIELEKHKNLAILRAGTNYSFSLGKGWGLGPALFFDFKEGIDTWALSVNVSKRF